MSTALNVAVVGIGWAGERQLQAMTEVPSLITPVALVDPDLDHASEVARRTGVGNVFADISIMLDEVRPDAVSICAPHDHHRPLVTECAAAGVHIICEKPIAPTVADATAMIDAAEQAGVHLYVAEHAAYEPVVDLVAGLIGPNSGIGELVGATLLTGSYNKEFYYAGRRRWLTDVSHGGTGTWMLHGVHKVAQIRAMMGEVTQVLAISHRSTDFQPTAVEGSMTAILHMDCGAAVTMFVTTESLLPTKGWKLTVHGRTGTVVAEPKGYVLLRPPSGDQPDAQASTLLSYSDVGLSAYARELAAFAKHVRGIEAGPTTAHSERRSLAVIEAGYMSAKRGTAVVIADQFGVI
jgi:UDP-N-acetyl-2-amino-2-deoxyglucuronate dehydrogenase